MSFRCKIKCSPIRMNMNRFLSIWSIDMIRQSLWRSPNSIFLQIRDVYVTIVIFTSFDSSYKIKGFSIRRKRWLGLPITTVDITRKVYRSVPSISNFFSIKKVTASFTTSVFSIIGSRLIRTGHKYKVSTIGR